MTYSHQCISPDVTCLHPPQKRARPESTASSALSFAWLLVYWLCWVSVATWAFLTLQGAGTAPQSWCAGCSLPSTGSRRRRRASVVETPWL